MSKVQINNPPVYTLTNKAIDLSMQISEIIGELKGRNFINKDFHLRKNNRLRSIQSSLAIENNSLSLEAVTDIINGKRVLGNPDEITEVKNAYNAYEHISEYNPFKVKDFLTVHKKITDTLVNESGKFRSSGVGVFDGTKMVHLGADYRFVPDLITDLFNWAKVSEVHPLIKSCIVHFEIEYIHPFVDGNGRIGRLWQTLILTKWNELFEWVPIETIVYERQQLYYDTLQKSQQQGDSALFIEFMLQAILDAVKDLSSHKITDIFTDKITDILTDKDTDFLMQILGYIRRNGFISNAKAQSLTGKSSETVKKYFVKFVKQNLLIPKGENRSRVYELNEDFLKK